ncbi:hypothetical protein AB0F85_19840 [Nocardia fluminea]|uniref:hypothetical protein n=1 Tax=Nocardia fluminea TaxID=134984 RepID=UPI0033F67942
MNTLGALGFGLSILVLLWNLYLTVMRWPRLSVELRQSVSIHVQFGSEADSPSPITETARIVVVNRGAEACTVANIGLRPGPEQGGAFDYRSASEKTGHWLPKGPELPARIEGHGCLVWTFDEEMLVKCGFSKGTSVFGYAERYTSFEGLPRFKKPGKPKTQRLESATQMFRNGGA